MSGLGSDGMVARLARTRQSVVIAAAKDVVNSDALANAGQPDRLAPEHRANPTMLASMVQAYDSYNRFQPAAYREPTVFQPLEFSPENLQMAKSIFVATISSARSAMRVLGEGAAEQELMKVAGYYAKVLAPLEQEAVRRTQQAPAVDTDPTPVEPQVDHAQQQTPAARPAAPQATHAQRVAPVAPPAAPQDHALTQRGRRDSNPGHSHD